MRIRLPVSGWPEWHPFAWAGALAWCMALGLALLQPVTDAARVAGVAAPDAGDSGVSTYRARQTDLRQLLATVPPLAERALLVDRVLRAGSTAGVVIGGGRYREEPVVDTALQRVTMTLPVTTRAPMLVEWVDDLGESVPTATLVRISLNRNAADEPLVGDVQIGLLLRSTP